MGRFHFALAVVGVLVLAAATVAGAAPFAYITNQASNTVSVVDVATNTVVTTVGVGTFPFGVGSRPTGHVSTWPTSLTGPFRS